MVGDIDGKLPEPLSAAQPDEILTNVPSNAALMPELAVMLPMFTDPGSARSMMFDRPVILPHVHSAALVAGAQLVASLPGMKPVFGTFATQYCACPGRPVGLYETIAPAA